MPSVLMCIYNVHHVSFSFSFKLILWRHHLGACSTLPYPDCLYSQLCNQRREEGHNSLEFHYRCRQFMMLTSSTGQDSFKCPRRGDKTGRIASARRYPIPHLYYPIGNVLRSDPALPITSLLSVQNEEPIRMRSDKRASAARRLLELTLSEEVDRCNKKALP